MAQRASGRQTRVCEDAYSIPDQRLQGELKPVGQSHVALKGQSSQPKPVSGACSSRLRSTHRATGKMTLPSPPLCPLRLDRHKNIWTCDWGVGGEGLCRKGCWAVFEIDIDHRNQAHHHFNNQKRQPITRK